MTSIGVLVAIGHASFEAGVLRAVDGAHSHVVRRCVDVPDLLATAASRQADAAIVSAELPGLDADVVARLRDHGVAVVAVTAQVHSADEAMFRRIGVDAIASADDLTSLQELLAETASKTAHVSALEATTPAASQGHRSGRLVAVWGPTGAPGRSTVALGLAAELAGLGADTLAVDADVYGGSLAVLLGVLDESSGLLAAARAANLGALDTAGLALHARQITPALRVLTGLPRADRWTEVKAVLLRSILETALELAAYTVVDCGFNLELDEEISYDTTAPRRNGATLEALKRADLVLAVGAADPVGLGRLIRGISDLRAVLPSVTPFVVVNRARSSLGWSEDQLRETVTRATGLSVGAVLPADPAACDKALLHGRTLADCASDSRISRALRAMAFDLTGLAAVPSRRRRLELRVRTPQGSRRRTAARVQ